MNIIDATGLTCPLPVVKARKALREIESGEIMVYVDNKTSAENLEKLAKSLKCGFALGGKAPRYEVKITKTQDAGGVGGVGDTIVVIEGVTMGKGDDALGESLMKAFIYALTESDAMPSAVVFYNGGAKLPVAGSPVLDDLKTLEQKGVPLYTCGACLNHYGLTESLAAGEITNMYAIVEMLHGAAKIIKP